MTADGKHGDLKWNGLEKLSTYVTNHEKEMIKNEQLLTEVWMGVLHKALSCKKRKE